jgi:hypothetical protein
VDNKGNASDTLGKKAPGKVYKDRATGILLQFSQGIVTNNFKFKRLFENRGLSIVDPTTGNTVTSTSDLELVDWRQMRSRSGLAYNWWASELRVYDPRFDSSTSN